MKISNRIHALLLPAGVCGAALVLAPGARALQGDLLAPSARASTPPGGGDANNWSRLPAISDDGRYTAFVSFASNLVPGDGNSNYDIYVYDRVANAHERMTVSTTGGDSNGVSYSPSISGDGRFVCFEGNSTNLTTPAGNGLHQIYVRDRQTATAQQASLSGTGVQANNTTETSQISSDGRFVVFLSYADNLVLGDTNNQRDAFVRDLTGGTTMLVSIASFNGAQSNAYIYNATISGNGRYVAYETAATNLIPGGTSPNRTHIYSYDTIGVATTLLSQSGGTEGNDSSRYPVFSDDGLFVAFHTDATNLLPQPQGPSSAVALLELSTGSFEQANIDSQGNPMFTYPTRCALSSDARFVSMVGHQGVPQNGGLFVRDRQLGLTLAACSMDDGAQPGGGSISEADISGDGTMVAMCTSLSLEAGDVMNPEDIYVRGIGAPAMYCMGKTSAHGCRPAIGFSGEARVSNNLDLTVTCTNAVNRKNGLLIYGVGGPRQASFQGGFLCISPPFAHSHLQNSGGNPPQTSDCSGSYSANLGTVLAGTPLGSTVGLGTPIYLQWWGRDPGYVEPNNTQLSDALQLLVGP